MLIQKWINYVNAKILVTKSNIINIKISLRIQILSMSIRNNIFQHIKIDVASPKNQFKISLVFKSQRKMKILILSLLSLVTGSTRLLPVAINPSLASVPQKLRIYQNATGISDDNLLSLFKRSVEGERSNDNLIFN